MRRTTLLIGVAFCSLFGVAQAEIISGGNVRVSFRGGVRPETLPRSTAAPIALHLAGTITAIEGMSLANVETYGADGRAGNDTLDYSASGLNAVNVNLATGNATGFASIAGIENAIGASGVQSHQDAQVAQAGADALK